MLEERSKPAANGVPKTRRSVRRAVSPSPDTAKPALEQAETAGGGAPLEIRETLAQLQAERAEMQRELDAARARILELERLADEDSLAPIANRRAFVRELSRMIAFTRRYGPPSSVIYFDVDGMKQINDTYGHPAGDAALRHVADLLCKNVRESDIVGRLGGDEFGVILTQTSQEQAHAKAATLAQAIAATALPWGKIEIPISAAYGVYSFSGSDDAQVAIEAADKAMYQRKRVTRPG
jgi:diguanylate cyclase (GGDEF)-like protein